MEMPPPRFKVAKLALEWLRGQGFVANYRRFLNDIKKNLVPRTMTGCIPRRGSWNTPRPI
jgi:hypothetical protein